MPRQSATRSFVGPLCAVFSGMTATLGSKSGGLVVGAPLVVHRSRTTVGESSAFLVGHDLERVGGKECLRLATLLRLFGGGWPGARTSVCNTHSVYIYMLFCISIYICYIYIGC